jgi:hypothetical protein
VAYSSGGPDPSPIAMLAFFAFLAVSLLWSSFSAVRNHSIMLGTARFSSGPGRILEGNSAVVVGAVLLGSGVALLGLAIVLLLLPN